MFTKVRNLWRMYECVVKCIARAGTGKGTLYLLREKVMIVDKNRMTIQNHRESGSLTRESVACNCGYSGITYRDTYCTKAQELLLPARVYPARETCKSTLPSLPYSTYRQCAVLPCAFFIRALPQTHSTDDPWTGETTRKKKKERGRVEEKKLKRNMPDVGHRRNMYFSSLRPEDPIDIFCLESKITRVPCTDL